MRLPILAAAVLTAANACAADPVQVGAVAVADLKGGLAVSGGAYHIFTAGVDHARIHLTVAGLPGADGAAKPMTVAVTAVDLWGKPVAWHVDASLAPGADGAAATDFDGPTDPGYYAITATIAATPVATTDLGIVPAQSPGQRRDSFFASNTANIRTGQDSDFLQKIGIRLQRVHFQPPLAAPAPATPNGALALDFTAQDAALAEISAKGQWVMPIAGYAIANLKTPLAETLKMHGPPRDTAEFVATWEQILRHYPDLGAIEFWNEPWIFVWTWADTPAAYRNLQKQWLEMAKRVNPKLRVVAGNSSMFVEDHFEQQPDCWYGLLQGTSHHPYSGADDPTFRFGSQRRSIDQGMVVTRRMGLPYYYLTEGGTLYAADEKASKNNRENATKIVQYYVTAALDGCFQGNAQWDLGYGPEWTRADTTLAVMTHLLEDRPVVADIWPAHELITGAIFANPSQITPDVRALPRAGELTARWDVAIPPAQQDDHTKVAVIWSETGPDNAHPDQSATLTIADPGDIHALDATGRPILPENGALTVPFGELPVYLLSDALDVVALRAKIAGAAIAKTTPANCYAQSLGLPADQAQSLCVRVESQANQDLDASVRVEPAGGKPGETQVHLPAGKLVDVLVPWSGVPRAPTNQYAVRITVTTPAGATTREQIIQVARIVKRTVPIDGTLAGWDGVVPVVLDSDQLRKSADLSQYILDPKLSLPTGTPEARRVIAHVYAAYDAANIYLAAAVDEDSFANRAGTLVYPGVKDAQGHDLPYREGDPVGLHHIKDCGDGFMVAFGFRDRVPGWGRQIDDPWAWKGHFYDTDDQFIAHPSADGDRLVRLWGEDTSRRTAYQTETVPGVGPVPGGKIVIRRDEAAKKTIYTLSIPRAAMPLFDPAKGQCRFSFLLAEDKPVNVGRALEWAEIAGVFDHWYGLGSFSPSWQRTLPCQTTWSIEP
jgi:hypothetical protein